MKFTLTILLSAFCILGYAQSEDVLLKKGDSLLKLNKATDALSMYSKALKLNPKSEKALKKRGYGYLTISKWAEGEKDYREAQKLNPNCSECYSWLAILNLIQNKPDSGLILADKAIAADGNSSLAFVSRARIYHALSKTAEAKADFAKAITLEPTNKEAYYRRAFMLQDNEDLEGAKMDFTAVIKIDSNDAEAHYQLGIVEANLSHFDAALNQLSIATKKDSLKSEYFTMTGNVYAATGDQNRAIKNYSKAILINPGDYQAWYARANSKYELEDMDAFCTDLKVALTKLPKEKDENVTAYEQQIGGMLAETCDSTRPGYFYQRGVAYYNLRQFDKAIAIYNRGLIKFPDHSTMTSFRGNAYLAIGNYKKAEEDYTRSLALSKNLRSEINQGWNYRDMDDGQKDLYAKGLVNIIYNSRAEARMKSGNDQGASEDVEEALAKLPENANDRDHTYVLKGILALNQNDNSAALTAFNKAIKLNGNNESAFVYRAIVKTNMAYKTKIIKQGIQLSGRGVNSAISLPDKEKQMIDTDYLRSALADANKAISLVKTYGYAYYIRAILKHELGEPDYCYDLLLAQKNGIGGIDDLISSYKCN